MVHDTLQQREQTPREFTSAMRQGVPLVLESKGDLVPWKYYAEIIPVKYTGKRPKAGRVLMDHDLDKVLEGWEGLRLQLGIPEVVRVELNDVELPLRNNVDLAHQRG